MTAFRNMLSEPLGEITQQMESFDPQHPEDSKLVIRKVDECEILQLKESYNQVIDDLIASHSKLKGTQEQLRHAN